MLNLIGRNSKFYFPPYLDNLYERHFGYTVILWFWYGLEFFGHYADRDHHVLKDPKDKIEMSEDNFCDYD